MLTHARWEITDGQALVLDRTRIHYELHVVLFKHFHGLITPCTESADDILGLGVVPYLRLRSLGPW